MFNLEVGSSLFAGYSADFLLSELGNFFFLTFVLIIFIRLDFLPKKYFLLWLFFLSTPFFFNYLLFDPNYLSDQFGYTSRLNAIHNGQLIENITLGRFGFLTFDNVWFTSYILSWLPVFSTQTITSIAFIHKLSLLISYVYLYKIIDNKLLSLTLLIPSMILFSSVSLREVPIIIFSIFSLIFLVKDKYIFSFISIFLVFILKIQHAPGLLLIFLSYLIGVHKSSFRIMLLIFGLIILSYFAFEFYIPILDLYRFAFFKEDGGNILELYEQTNYFSFLGMMFSGTIQFLIRPLPTDSGLLGALVFFEIFSIYILIYYLVRKLDKKYQGIVYLTVIGVSVTLLMYGYIASNYGTFSRYRFSTIIPLVYLYIYLLTNKEKKNIA